MEEIKRCLNWGEIVKGIEECPIGMKITRDENLKKLEQDLQSIIQEAMVIFTQNDKEKLLNIAVSSEDQIDWRTFPKKESRKRNSRFTRCPQCGYPDGE